jgi:hypothetical protein
MSTEKITEWLTVPQSDINKPESKNRNGVKIQFMLSPADVPVAWREILDDSESKPGKYIIEFKYYSSPEPTKLAEHGDGVQVVVGRNSKRIYSIIIDLMKVFDACENTKIELKLGLAADHSVEQLEHEGALSSGNADAIRRFLKPVTKGGELLFSHLAHG